MSTLFYFEKRCLSIENTEIFSKKRGNFTQFSQADGWKVAFFCAACVKSMVPA